MPLISTAVLRIAVLFYLAFFVLAVVLSIMKRNKKFDKYFTLLMQKIANLALSFSIIGMILLFFRHQLVPYLGMRGWTLIWWLICLVWFVYVLKYWTIVIPAKRKELQKKREKEKYLP
ncbi:MAG: hypothetical protein AUJ28_00265 [Parcubacteria group bacterium CG1_02_37_51]|uniref:DUF5671 domain-containing protein n=2 Tax=Candidatus Komeiliibacteriota TaxID=1817908 RepID=A0A2M8DPZ0_9BACT|nr:MAG: hypothetical protein AUJ28_00265 [Parcubacteria group bacterium CG1_02_37_51]PIY95390.1 MAG: hypothetical protein COY67_00195 [Candidatus Komeilibacteria bacterium CG_4_10_14_0_8_um_filter_37_78]PJC00968.1 MAG: hypothetical protein CO073_04795 [Candidatus Komeilibacteria bacterium CG_4_9_14_0_8_um_filter_36_9]